MTLKLLLSLATFLILLPSTSFASTLSISPTSGNVGLGSILPIQIRLNTNGEAVNAISAYLSYPSDKVEIAYIRASNIFSVEAENSFGNGQIKIARGNSNGVTGNVIVATVGIRGKAIGEVPISFISGSAAPKLSDSADTLNLTSSTNTNLNVVNATPTPSTAIKTLQAAQITSIEEGEIGPNTAVINVKTSTPTTAIIQYGLISGKYILSSSSTTLSTTHSIKIGDPNLAKGSLIYYKVTTVNQEDTETVSDERSLQLQGYAVSVFIKDSNQAPLHGTPVVLYSNTQHSETNENGEANFKNVTPGKHLALIQGASIEKGFEIEVSDNNDLEKVQKFEATVASMVVNNGRNFSIFGVDVAYIAFMAALAMLALNGLMIILMRRRSAQFDEKVDRQESNLESIPKIDSSSGVKTL